VIGLLLAFFFFKPPIEYLTHKRERKHIHVTYARKGFKRSCKFWLEPNIELVESKKGDFTQKELKEIEKLIQKHQRTLLDQLALFYENKDVKAIRLWIH